MTREALRKIFYLYMYDSADMEHILSCVDEYCAAQIAQSKCYAGRQAEPLPDKAYCSECGMAVNSSHQQHYHWCSLAGNDR